MRILFFGTPTFSLPSLKAVATSKDLVGVVTQPDKPKGRGYRIESPPIKKLSQELGLPVWQPESLGEKSFINFIRGLKANLFVVVAFGQIFPREVLEIPKMGVINLHPSLLPKYRGAAPIPWAIINGERESGVTIIRMSEELDAGDILLQEKVKIGPRDDAGWLHDVLSKKGAKLLIEAIDLIEKGEVIYKKQDSTKATYAPKITMEERVIDWSKGAIEIYNLIRGLKPFWGAHTYLEGKMLKVWEAEPIDLKIGDRIGKIINVERDGLIVGCGKGALRIKELQLEGKEKMSVKDYLLGHKVKEGTILGISS